jgi:hypothetical protein
MENNVLCYVQRSLITKWKRLVLTHDEPLFVYGSDDDHVFATRLKDGGILWVIASTPGGSPELVARLDVEMVRERGNPELDINPRFLRKFEYKWIAKGKDNSEFFGHNNAEKALLQLAFGPKNGEPWKIEEGATQWQGKYGSKLQSPRYICETGELEKGLISLGNLPLLDLQKKKSRAVFLSWKWRDNTKNFMRSLASELVAEGFMPWLDLLAMPWSQHIEQREKDKPKLEKLLKYGYQHSAAIIAIDSENYGTPTEEFPNWTKREWEGELAKNIKIKKLVYRPKGNKKSKLIQKSGDGLPVFEQPQAEFACGFRKWFDENLD